MQGLIESTSQSFKQAFPRVSQTDLAAIQDTDQRLFASYIVEAFMAYTKLDSADEVDQPYLGGVSPNQDAVPRPLHPQLVNDRIGIPTVYVAGRADSTLALKQSENLEVSMAPSTNVKE